MNDRLPAHAIVDVETSGLDPNQHVILEIAIVLANHNFEPLYSQNEVIADATALDHLAWLESLAAEEPQHRAQEPWKGAKKVCEMHQANGLAAEIRALAAAGMHTDLATAQDRLVTFLRGHGVGQGLNLLPMTGSSILFDRQFIQRQMPQLNAEFHYRNTDISSLKNLAERYRRDVIEGRDAAMKDKRRELHRALYDCYDSLLELEYYIKHMVAKR